MKQNIKIFCKKKQRLDLKYYKEATNVLSLLLIFNYEFKQKTGKDKKEDVEGC